MSRGSTDRVSGSFSVVAAASMAVALGLKSVEISDETILKTFTTPTALLMITGVVLAGIAAAIVLYTRSRRELMRKVRRVFIIYSRHDSAKALEIADLLRQNDIEPWLDVEQIDAGQIWQEAAFDGLANSLVALVLVSPSLTESKFAEAELKYALSRMASDDSGTSPVIPLLIDGSEPPSFLSHIQYVDTRTANWHDFLIRSLNRAMERILVAQRVT
jgi:hypothetical protein